MASKFRKYLPWVGGLLTLILIAGIWFRRGFDSVQFDTDVGRDLSDVSPLWQHHMVWLGPYLSGGSYNTTPLYYYSLFPLIWLTHGNAQSIVITTLLIALGTMGLFLWGMTKQYRRFGWVVVLTMALLPWWQVVSLHPGNGFTYAVWTFAALSSLWFELPLVLSALLFGFAFAYHPAAVFLFPILLYEWWRRGHSWKVLLTGLTAFLLPWIPIFGFEIITKWFLTRQFLASHSTTIHPGFSTYFLQQLSSYMGLSVPLLLVSWIGIGFVSRKRSRAWYIVISLILIGFSYLGRLEAHYVFGLTALVSFYLLMMLGNNRWLRGILIIWLVVEIYRLIFIPMVMPTRTISRIQSTADTVIQSQVLDQTKKYAVVAALDESTPVPQADDYRYFLRVRGFSVLPVQSYGQADRLLMFIEFPGFDWQHWSSWEIDQVRPLKFLNEQDINGIKIIQYERQRN